MSKIEDILAEVGIVRGGIFLIILLFALIVDLSFIQAFGIGLLIILIFGSVSSK